MTFLSLIEKGCGSTKKNEAELKMLLDKLAMVSTFATYKFDEKNYADAPRRTYEDLRKLVTTQFPNIGHYNVAEDVTKNIGNVKRLFGDAIDDIADIAGDLFEARMVLDKQQSRRWPLAFKNILRVTVTTF